MPRGIIDPAKSIEDQKKQLEEWMTSELNAHFEAKEKMKEPAFRRTASGTLHTQNFMLVYDLIECIVAVEAFEERNKNDKARFELFNKAIV